MRYRRLGESGLVVSVVGIGCNNFGGRIDLDQASAVVDAAIEAGVTLFDTADVYGSPQGNSEQVLGQVLGNRREDVIIATKFGIDMGGANGRDFGARGGRHYLVRAVEASLRRLGTDYIDLYQMHVSDPGTPIEETLSVLHDLVRSGKVRYLGHSNFAGWQVADAAWVARTARLTPFVSAQNEYSLLKRDAEADLVPACRQFGLGLLPYFPLANGLLTGKYSPGEAAPAGSRLARDGFSRILAEAPWTTIEQLKGYAAARGRTLIDIAIGGLLALPGVASVIAGATTAAQVQANAAATTWRPTSEDLTELDSITRW